MGLITAGAVVGIFFLGFEKLRATDSNSYVVFVLIALGYWFFILAPQAYGIQITPKHKKTLYIFAIIIVGFLSVVLFSPLLSGFFDLRRIELIPSIITGGIIILAAFVQYIIIKRWFLRKA
jgi:hypothetical protein